LPQAGNIFSYIQAHRIKNGMTWQDLSELPLKRINKLIEGTMREPFEGIGKPELLRENLSGFWSRQVDDTNRLVYAVEDDCVTIISCRYHYNS
jgi:toxin YoeB